MNNPTPANPAMNDNLLFEQFATLATAPEGIARMRELILRLAIYGKLETHDTKDKPAKLRENDRNEDRSLGIFTLIHLPKGWVWTKLGNIAEVGQGGTPSTNFPEYWKGSVPWLRSGDIKFNRIKKANETISEIGLKNSAAKLCPIGTVLLAMTGQGVTRGRAAILDIEASANQSCAHIILDKNFLIPEFLFYFFKTEYWNIRTLDKGTGQPGINTKIIKSFDIPLPPLAEQHRIVAKVDRLMALCDKLEVRQQQERAGCLKLGTASLAGLQNTTHSNEFERQWAQVCDAFDLILDCPENVAVLRQTIHLLAVQGRLGTQDPRDETADKLLKRIQKENKKNISKNGERKFKIPDPVNVDEQKGDIPLGWWWSKLPEIVKPEKKSIKRGPFGSAIIKAYFVPKGYKIYEQKNAIYDDFSIGNYYINDVKFDELRDFEIKPNDIIISCAGTVGKLAIVPENIERGIINQALLKITLNNNVMTNEYFRILFASFLMKTDTLSDLKGTAMKNIVSLDLLRKIVFPLPPLAEQHRIVAKVDALMKLCDALESQLKARAEVQEQLAGAVVKQVVDGVT